jgi:hypothetical protein
MMKLPSTCLLVFLFAMLQHGAEPSHENTPSITLRLVQPTHPFDGARSIKVEAVITNVGDETILVCRNLDLASSTYCEWNPRVRDASGNTLPGVGVAVDKGVGQRDDFATALIKDWLALAPGTSYSAPIEIAIAFSKQPIMPGRYEFMTGLISRGPQADSVYNDLLQFPSDLKKLPYRGWVGRVESNAISIEVAGSKN